MDRALGGEVVKRRYNSTRRRAQARENQLRILRAAGELVIQRGYGQTAIADVAARAGVAAETVYSAFKNKPALLHRAWDVTVGGDDLDVPVLARPELRAAPRPCTSPSAARRPAIRPPRAA